MTVRDERSRSAAADHGRQARAAYHPSFNISTCCKTTPYEVANAARGRTLDLERPAPRRVRALSRSCEVGLLASELADARVRRAVGLGARWVAGAVQEAGGGLGERVERGDVAGAVGLAGTERRGGRGERRGDGLDRAMYAGRIAREQPRPQVGEISAEPGDGRVAGHRQ